VGTTAKRQSRYRITIGNQLPGTVPTGGKALAGAERSEWRQVFNVSSYGHQMAPFNFEDPNFEHRAYETLQAYGQSKTASNLFALELDNKAKAFNVRAYSLHPGSIHGTELARNADLELFKQMGFFGEDGNIRPEIIDSLKTIPQGAATAVWCATSPMLQGIGGVYCEDGDIAELDLGNFGQDNGLGTRGVQEYSLDERNAKRLWSLTQDLTGIIFEVS
jgi:NAD(P)-dependent dehydrogenase (short-subunit alcohol dehydrogenase family)